VRIVVQRVDRASVDVDGERVSEIGRGLLLLVGIAVEDSRVDRAKAAEKIVGLRIFADDEGKMNRSLRDAEGAILAVSQFTLYADTRKGRRPGFTAAARPEQAEALFDAFVEALRGLGAHVKTGRFGAKMAVELVNAGPVTFVIDVDVPSAGG
jgi:D-tyrosyl-tRNA(Tyr) deacylase